MAERPEQQHGPRRPPGRLGGWLVRLLPFAWLCAFLLVPLAIILRIAVSSRVTAQPPYTPVFDVTAGLGRLLDDLGSLTLDNFALVASDAIYLDAFLTSLRIAVTATGLTLLLALPMAKAIAGFAPRWRPLLLLLIVLPFWTSFLIRIYAWIAILKPEGLLNAGLLALGVIERPLTILNTEIAVHLGIVYAYLPFMVLPIYASLTRIDPALAEAAADLGASRWQTFRDVTLPLAAPGILAGCLLVFIPATGEFIIPDLLGGPDTLMIGSLVWTEFFTNRDWPVAATVSLLAIVVLMAPILLRQRLAARLERGQGA